MLADFGDIDLNFELNGKQKNAKDDIVHVRSIVLTRMELASILDPTKGLVNIFIDIPFIIQPTQY